MKRVIAEYPYNNYYLYVIFHKKELRRYASLVPISNDSGEKRKTISYARYLMSVKMKRILNESEEVDHIDNNKLNDEIDNLQILTKKENIEKENKRRGRKFVTLRCPSCRKIFEIEKRNSFIQKGSVYTCCSIECNNKLKSITKSSRDKKTLYELIDGNFVNEFVMYG